MTGQPNPRTRRDAIRDWMILTFTLAVIAAAAGAAFASLRLLGVAAVFLATSAVLACVYSWPGGKS